MEEYITRLISMGYGTQTAICVVFSFLRERDYDGLEAFIAKMEARKCS